jgi:metal-sulfur cluster biosynthetic enzyme
MTEINAARTSLEDVEEALKDVIDPELGVNVVDLGLLYGLKYSDEDGALLIDTTAERTIFYLRANALFT